MSYLFNSYQQALEPNNRIDEKYNNRTGNNKTTL